MPQLPLIPQNTFVAIEKIYSQARSQFIAPISGNNRKIEWLLGANKQMGSQKCLTSLTLQVLKSYLTK